MAGKLALLSGTLDYTGFARCEVTIEAIVAVDSSERLEPQLVEPALEADDRVTAGGETSNRWKRARFT